MKWQTETEIPQYPFTIKHSSKILLLGSCFAQNIGDLLTYYKFNALQNPFGIVFNPLSLRRSVDLLCSNKTYQLEDLNQDNGLFFSYDHHSSFSDTSAEKTLLKINTALQDARLTLPKTDVVFISLGTAFYWELLKDKRLVNNCHKQPNKLFEQKCGSVSKVIEALKDSIELLQKSNSRINIVLTVSPIRHLKHGSAGNQLSKATLLVAVHECVRNYDFVHYFPSYELVLDDLRDYRWYAEDLIHPNKMAIKYIWNKFKDALFNEETIKLLKEIEKINNLMAHRVMHMSDNQTENILSKINALAAQIPLDFNDEITRWKRSLDLE